MRHLILAYLILHSVFTFSQSSWNTATRVGYNRIGLGFDQSVGYSFGDRKEHSLSLGAKWYWFDVVFAKETVGLTVDYRYKFRAVDMPMQFSLGYNTSAYIEKFDDHRSRIAEISLYNRGTLIRFSKIQPFYELGVGAVIHRTSAFGPYITSSYYNFLLSFGVQIKLGRD